VKPIINHIILNLKIQISENIHTIKFLEKQVFIMNDSNFENYGFEHLKSGYVLMNPKGGSSYSFCILISEELFETIQLYMEKDNDDDDGHPIEFQTSKELLDDLTQDLSENHSTEQRIQYLVNQNVLNNESFYDCYDLYVYISNLWYKKYSLKCATKPLELPEFIQAVQHYEIEVQNLNLVTEWSG
jgi:hypothetical protein